MVLRDKYYNRDGAVQLPRFPLKLSVKNGNLGCVISQKKAG